MKTPNLFTKRTNVKIGVVALVLAAYFVAPGCSGFLPSLTDGGKTVSPEYLARYEGYGSLSTLWYRGSDDNYHYFAHFVKAKTHYKIRRERLVWENEYPLGSRQTYDLVTNQIASYLERQNEASH